MAVSPSASAPSSKISPSTKNSSLCPRSPKLPIPENLSAKNQGRDFSRPSFFPIFGLIKPENQSTYKISPVKEVRHLCVVAKPERVAEQSVRRTPIRWQIPDVSPQPKMPAQIIFHASAQAVTEFRAVRISSSPGVSRPVSLFLFLARFL